jgi:hypothetical protein
VGYTSIQLRARPVLGITEHKEGWLGYAEGKNILQYDLFFITSTLYLNAVEMHECIASFPTTPHCITNLHLSQADKAGITTAIIQAAQQIFLNSADPSTEDLITAQLGNIKHLWSLMTQQDISPVN